MERVKNYIHDISFRKTALLGVIFALWYEFFTCVSRFMLHLQSTRDTAFLSNFTFGLRIHHGYIGFALMCISPFLKTSHYKKIMLIAGIMLFLSDLIHHFGVLLPVTGTPGFDFFYPL